MNLNQASAHLNVAGYFQESATAVYTFCPACRARLSVEVVAWAKPRERTAALAGVLSEHTTDCRRAE